MILLATLGHMRLKVQENITSPAVWLKRVLFIYHKSDNSHWSSVSLSLLVCGIYLTISAKIM